ncbi:hypothetical protein [Brevibacillus laterosporus]|uniref:hypothetical protein n=1 Tax=Brevibacillus laterosporus TaxID=1465 RepID=UPI003D1D85CD
MITVQVDENEVRKVYLDQLKEKIAEVDVELVFWDRKELLRKTCMCWNSIQKSSFLIHDSQNTKSDPNGIFPRKKLGSFYCNGYQKKINIKYPTYSIVTVITLREYSDKSIYSKFNSKRKNHLRQTGEVTLQFPNLS